MSSSVNRFATAVLAVLVATLMILVLTSPQAGADHEPANKVAAAGSTLEEVNPEERIPVLQERVKVSSPFDLILSLSSECSILTALRTGNDDVDGEDLARAFGQLKFSIEIDGNIVPVTSTETTPPGPGTATDQPGSDGQDVGEVVFCNREYQRSVMDSEDDDDGLDTEEDFIRTRTSNAFNWLALDVGFNYDEPLAGQSQNVVDIVVYAEFDKDDTVCPTHGTPAAGEDSCVQAIVGRRTLIAEPTNASIHEWVQPTDPDGGF